MRHLLDAVDGANVAKRVEGRAETSMDTEYMILHHAAQCDDVKDLAHAQWVSVGEQWVVWVVGGEWYAASTCQN